MLRQQLRVPVAAVTGMDGEYLDLVDRRLGLTALFDGRVYRSDVLGYHKPEPWIVLHAAREMRVLPEACALFGDAANDIAAGVRAGVRVVAYTGTFSQESLIHSATAILGFPPDGVLFIDTYDSPGRVICWLRTA